jgi:hypothetical protein
MSDLVTPTELSRLLALSIYQIIEQQQELNPDCSTILADTYIRLQEVINQPVCLTKNKEINPALVSALGVMAYQEYCNKNNNI